MPPESPRQELTRLAPAPRPRREGARWRHVARTPSRPWRLANPATSERGIPSSVASSARSLLLERAIRRRACGILCRRGASRHTRASPSYSAYPPRMAWAAATSCDAPLDCQCPEEPIRRFAHCEVHRRPDQVGPRECRVIADQESLATNSIVCAQSSAREYPDSSLHSERGRRGNLPATRRARRTCAMPCMRRGPCPRQPPSGVDAPRPIAPSPRSRREGAQWGPLL